RVDVELAFAVRSSRDVRRTPQRGREEAGIGDAMRVALPRLGIGSVGPGAATRRLRSVAGIGVGKAGRIRPVRIRPRIARSARNVRPDTLQFAYARFSFAQRF